MKLYWEALILIEEIRNGGSFEILLISTKFQAYSKKKHLNFVTNKTQIC